MEDKFVVDFIEELRGIYNENPDILHKLEKLRLYLTELRSKKKDLDESLEEFWEIHNKSEERFEDAKNVLLSLSSEAYSMKELLKENEIEF